MRKRILRYSILLSISLFSLWIAFRGQDLGELSELISKVPLWPILLGSVLQFASHAVRAARWRVFLLRANPHVTFGQTYRATLAGFGLNNIIPRGGEVARAYVVCREGNVALPAAITTIVLDRLGDFLGLGLIVAISLAIYGETSFRFLTGAELPISSIITVAIALLAFILAGWLSRKKLLALFSSLLSDALRTKCALWWEQMMDVFRGAGRKELNAFFSGSIAIWGLYTLSMYVAVWAFDDPALSNVGFLGFILLQALSGIAFIVPTPGGTGTYHVVISMGLSSIFGVPADVALAYVVLTHGSNYISSTLVGVTIFTLTGLKIRSVVRTESEEIAEESAAIRGPKGSVAERV